MVEKNFLYFILLKPYFIFLYDIQGMTLNSKDLQAIQTKIDENLHLETLETKLETLIINLKV